MSHELPEASPSVDDALGSQSPPAQEVFARVEDDTKPSSIDWSAVEDADFSRALLEVGRIDHVDRSLIEVAVRRLTSLAADNERFWAESARLDADLAAERGARQYDDHQLHQELDSMGAAPSQSLLIRLREVRQVLAARDVGAGPCPGDCGGQARPGGGTCAPCLEGALALDRAAIRTLTEDKARLADERAMAEREVEVLRARLAEAEAGLPAYRRERLPDERESVTRKFVVGGQKGYVTAGRMSGGRLGEVFVKMAKPPETVGRTALIQSGEELRAAYEMVRTVGASGVAAYVGDPGPAVRAAQDLDRALERWASTVRAASEATSASWSMIAGLCDALAIMTSLALQAGVPLEKVADKMLRLRFEPAGPTNDPDQPMASSIVDYVFGWLLRRFGSSAAEVAG